MKRFMLLHFGFETPTPEIMAAWNKWFESVADQTVEQGGLRDGREISHSGTKDLPMGMESITGYSIIKAESLDDAEEDRSGQSIHCEHPGLRNHGTLGLVPENLRRPPIPAPNNPTNIMSCSLGHNGE